MKNTCCTIFMFFHAKNNVTFIKAVGPTLSTSLQFIHYNSTPSFHLLIPDTIGLQQKTTSYTSDQQLVIKLL